MEKMLPDGRSSRYSRAQRFRAAGLSVLLALGLSGTALAQQTRITGTVTNAGGAPLRGVTVRLQGTDTRTLTDVNGRYAVVAPANGVLSFSLIGQRVLQAGVDGRSTVDVRMEPIAFLEEITVTGYTEQRRAEITGAVASVNLASAERQTTASVLQRLDATVSGVTVSASGSPGSRSTVRVRGVSSFQNNDPLYIVDGVPAQDTYVNWLNPNDIESVQVLKDASAASIYGSRASNGVIIITTKKGVAGPARTRLSVRTGMTSPVRGYDDFLITDAMEYFEIIRQSYRNAGLPIPTNVYGDSLNPSVPQYIYAAGAPVDQWGRPMNVNEAAYSFPRGLIMPGSAGTNWWKAVFGTGLVGDYNLDVSGGGEDNTYGVGFNFFNQEGTAAFNEFKRGSARVNTAFTRGKLRVGENVALSFDRHRGGVPNDAFDEGGILGKNILMQPVVPVYDVQGNFASGKATTLGNNTNPLKSAWAARDNENKNGRAFGNVFAGFAFTDQLNVRSSFGFNLAQGSFVGFTAPNPENSEETFTNLFTETTNQFTEWTLSNTVEYERSLAQHNVSVLLGQEANASRNRFLTAQIANLIDVISFDPNARYIQDALGDAASKNVTSTGAQGSLLSFFGRADYNFADRYVASFTLRQDGSSRLGLTNRWGTFPAFGAGWRISNEPFMAGNALFSDVMLRFGWGITGNQSIPEGRIVSQFGGTRGDTYYDVGGNNTVAAGFRQTSLGNPDLKWEENRSVNVGADVGMLEGRVNFVLDVYRRNTDNLLFNPPTPATAGLAAPPFVNIGAMSNQGFDFSVGYNVPAWSVTFTGSRYRNKIVRIDGVQDFFYGPITTRFGNQVINQVGHPIGSFYGYLTDGFFRDAADAAAHTRNPTTDVCPGTYCQDGAAEGRIKFRDFDGDGQITLADRTIIGSPHPDFTGGLDFAFRRGDWDLSATVFGSFGNEIFDVQKEFYVFRNFSTTVRRDLLTDSWTPQNPNAKYPRLDVNDNVSRALSDFYVEDGSYVRMRNVQLGWNVPPRFARWMPAARVFLQAENLFTITGYPGLDPALPVQAVTGPAGDIRDQYRGVDRGTYPSNRTFSFGLITTF